MKFLIEFNPAPEVKNAFEKDPDLQKKVGEALERMKPLSAWFTLRRGIIVVDANSSDELARMVAPLLHIFKVDPKISPAYSLEEFPKLVANLGEEAKKYGL